MNERAFAVALALLMLTFGFPSAVTGMDGPIERLAEHEITNDEPQEYIVGFYDLPRDHDEYQGEPVMFIDQDLTYFVVETEDPYQFEIRVQTDDRVRYLEENHDDYQLAYTPNDDRYADQYGVQQSNAPSAWDTTLGSTAVNLGLLDSGITAEHEDFDATHVDGWNYVDGNDDISDYNGCNYHGSHTAGSAAALTDNGVGIAGMSNSAIIMQKIFDDGAFGCGAATTSDIAQALKDLGDQGAHISSNSWGGGSDQALIDAIDYASNKGVIHVAAAGNSGSCTDCVGEPWKSAQDQVIIVSASAEGDTWASFSSEGPEVSVIAPGDSILSVDGGTTTGYQSMSGTSMSTPHVAGAVGLYIDAHGHPGDHATMEQLVRDTADDIGLPSDRQGDGQLNAGALVGDGAAGPTASFTSSCTDLSCTFDGSGSTGDITSYDWGFGDSNTGTGETVDHTYAEGGTYTVTLTVTDADGETDQASETVSVSSDDAGDGALFFDGFEDGSLSSWTESGTNSLWRAADDCVDVWNGAWMLAFSLEGTCTYDDGHAAGTVTSPVIDASGQDSLTLEFAHFFEVESWSGEYDVMQVQVSADGGSSFDVIAQWDSRDATNTDWTVETFDISAYATSELALRFSFDSQDSSYNGFPGWYIDDIEVTGQASDTNDPPTASFTSSCTDLSCSFDGSGSSDTDGTISSYDWDFGDGNTGTGETTSHAYAAGGTYTVTLTVTDDDGATGSTSQDVTVEEPAAQTVYAEDFSDGTADGWTKSSMDNDLWRVADDCVSVPVPTHQLAFSQSSTCDYDVGHAVGWVNSPTMDTSGYSTVTLEFTHFFEVESWSGEYDVMQVQVSQDGGSSWDVIAQWDSRDATNDQHETVTFDVSSFASSQFEVRYHFDSQDGSYNGFQGWYIDDIKIVGE